MRTSRMMLSIRKISVAIALALVLELPLLGKVAIDFDPNVDFSKYKAFAYVGGVEKLAMMPLNPDLINNRVHRMVVRELTTKGLREVQPGQDPDLVVRYWANSTQQVNLAAMGQLRALWPVHRLLLGLDLYHGIAQQHAQGFLDRGFDRPQE